MDFALALLLVNGSSLKKSQKNIDVTIIAIDNNCFSFKVKTYISPRFRKKICMPCSYSEDLLNAPGWLVHRRIVP